MIALRTHYTNHRKSCKETGRHYRNTH